MEEIIIFSKKFHRSIEELIEVLFLKNYFGFESDCQNYGDRIYDFVVNNISSIPVSKNSPQEFQKYGKKYLRYEDNNQIYWYIFLDQKRHSISCQAYFKQPFPRISGIDINS